MAGPRPESREIPPAALRLVPVETEAQRDAARELVREYLVWVAGIARSAYGIDFDIDAMVESDLADTGKFFPPAGRFYLVGQGGAWTGVGCLKRLAPGVGEIQRMYVRPQGRGTGAGRRLVERLLEDARALGYLTLRLESLKALDAAHALYRSVGFREIDPYAQNSMRDYQPPEGLDKYRQSAVFMELRLDPRPGDVTPQPVP